MAQIVNQLGGVGRVNAAPNQRRNDFVIGAIGFSELYGDVNIRRGAILRNITASDSITGNGGHIQAWRTRRFWFCSDSLETLPYFSAMLIAFNKPYGVLSQFTRDASRHRPLAEFGFPKNVYPVGRLDADSEGLLLLSDEPQLNQLLLHPRHAHQREYWVQVERVPTAQALRRLEAGLVGTGPRHAALPSVEARAATGDSTARSAHSLP